MERRRLRRRLAVTAWERQHFLGAATGARIPGTLGVAFRDDGKRGPASLLVVSRRSNMGLPQAGQRLSLVPKQRSDEVG
jgi:hypothetical protein